MNVLSRCWGRGAFSLTTWIKVGEIWGASTVNGFKTHVCSGQEHESQPQGHFWNIEGVLLSTQLLIVPAIWITRRLIYPGTPIHVILGFRFKRGIMTSGSHRVLVHSKWDNPQDNIPRRNEAVVRRETGEKWLGCLSPQAVIIYPARYGSSTHFFFHIWTVSSFWTFMQVGKNRFFFFGTTILMLLSWEV